MAETRPDPLKTRHVGDHPDVLGIEGYNYTKVQDLRYGTNPSQAAALYNLDSFLGSLRELRTGKQGPSQTNFEDIFFGAVTAGYFDAPSAIIMKHENPSGFATQYEPEALSQTYRKARDTDFRAAFGGTVLVNRPVDVDTAEAIKELFTEVLVAPAYDEGVVGRFKGSIRIFEYGEKEFRAVPRFAGNASEPELKRLPDGSIIRSDVFVSPIRLPEELQQYVVSRRRPTERELLDLLTGYRIRLRSNSVRFVKNGYTTGLGTGQQDRIMCIDIAAYKNRKLAELANKEGRRLAADYNIAGSVLVSDGFFPFTDSIELAKELGITAVLAPHGGERFQQVLDKANGFGMAFVDLPGEMRFFDHH